MRDFQKYVLSRRGLCSYAISSMLINCAPAQSESSSMNSYFVLSENFNLNSLLIAKPVVDDLDEANEIFNMKYLRTKETVMEIKFQDKQLIEFFIERLDLSNEKKVETHRRLSLVSSDVADIVMYFKKHFNRPRPSELLPEIEPVIDVPAHRSYPSGHATQAMVMAILLSEWLHMPPEFLEKIAERVGKNREIAGLHYPSDTKAGFDLARQISSYLMNV